MRHASVEETFGGGAGDDDDFNLSILGTVHVLIVLINRIYQQSSQRNILYLNRVFQQYVCFHCYAKTDLVSEKCSHQGFNRFLIWLSTGF